MQLLYRFFSIVFSVAFIFLAHFPAASARDVSMVTTDWQPYYGSGLKNDGVVGDIATTALKRSGHVASIKYVPWARALKMVAEGRDDIVLGAYYNEERAKTYLYSDPFYDIVTGLVARRDADVENFSSLQDLSDYNIGVSRGWAYTENFDRANYLKKDIAKNPTINLKKLMRNRIDIMAVAFGIFSYELSQIEGGNIDEFVFLDPPLATNPLYLMVSKEIPDAEKIVSDFNKGLRNIKADGTYDKILKNHGF